MSEIFQSFLPHTLNRLQAVMVGMKSPSGTYYNELQALGVVVPQIQIEPTVVDETKSQDTQFQFSNSTLNALMSCFLIDLLKMSVRLSVYPELPEVYCFDGQRLSDIRDDLDALVLLACIGISIKQLVYSLRPLQISNPAEAKDMEEALFYRLDTLLRQPGSKLMDSLCVEATRYVEQLVEKRVRDTLDTGGTAIADDSWKVNLRKSIEANTASSSPIMTLIVKRTYELLMRGLLCPSTVESVLQKYSMATTQQTSAVKSVISKSKLLLTHHSKVHENTYKTLLKLIIVSGSANSS